ncbi:hypothetical protein CTA1_7866 [Colletotrichum tanaceti]|uniref:Uncharacterized protein n=1 Tax=Colletotrichum tanaceti TaxID=1306861 RepID=A0A4U6XUR2_9PEZI|nr:hypothetical protein CTA1_7866 [Colletotrichum tanaceti]
MGTARSSVTETSPLKQIRERGFAKLHAPESTTSHPSHVLAYSRISFSASSSSSSSSILSPCSSTLRVVSLGPSSWQPSITSPPLRFFHLIVTLFRSTSKPHITQIIPRDEA